MPELPEVETVARGLKKKLLGQHIGNVIQRRKDLRFPFPKNFSLRLTGRQIVDVTRRAKYIVVHLDDGNLWLCHLGMSGTMILSPKAPLQFGAHDHLIVETKEGTWLRYNDARRFGMMDLIRPGDFNTHKLLKNLGPEPLEHAFNATDFADVLKGKKISVKAALLDQRLVAGVGNIYASEALFRAGLSPKRIAGKLNKLEVARLIKAVKEVLRDAIKAGGSSLRDYVQTDGELGYFQHRWRVYGKEGQPCPQCRCEGTKYRGIQRIEQGGRSSFYCPLKQA